MLTFEQACKTQKKFRYIDGDGEYFASAEDVIYQVIRSLKENTLYEINEKLAEIFTGEYFEIEN